MYNGCKKRIKYTKIVRVGRSVYGTPAVEPYAAMPAMLARPSFPMGYYGQGNRFPLMPNPNWMSVREQCYNISSFRNGSSLKLGELTKPSLSLSPPLVWSLFLFCWGVACFPIQLLGWCCSSRLPILKAHLHLF